MKLRIVRTSRIKSNTAYAILFADGTMLKDVEFNDTKLRDLKEKRKLELRALHDILNDFKNAEKLSAKRYHGTDRWDSETDDMAVWGSNRMTDELVVSDDGELHISNPLLFERTLNTTPADDMACTAYIPQEDDIHHPQRMKLRLVKQNDGNFRNGLCLLYPDGTMNSHIVLDDMNQSGGKELGELLSNFESIDTATSPTGERWDVNEADPAHPLTDISSYGSNLVNELVVTGDDRLIVFDAAVLMTIHQSQSASDLDLDKIRWVSPIQYCYIAYLNGIFDDRFRDRGIDPRNMDDNTMDKQMNILRCHVLNIIRKNQRGAFNTGDKTWKGFPFANENSELASTETINYRIPVFYPEDGLEYERNGGHDGIPCLPMYPTNLIYYESYKPVYLTDEAKKWLDTRFNKKGKVRKSNKRGRTRGYSLEAMYEAARNIADTIDKYRNEGKTISEVSQILFAEREEKNIRGNEPTKTTPEERLNAVHESVQRRWGTLRDRKKLVSDLALQGLTIPEIAKGADFTESYTITLLKSLAEGERDQYQAGKLIYPVGENALQQYNPEVAEFLRNNRDSN